MKVLVFSDSHSALQFMRLCVESIQPDAIIHLGDHYDDGEVLKETYPRIAVWQVPGNCDKYRVPDFVPDVLIRPVFGVNMYMTHGHKHGVKMGIGALVRDARLCRCEIALYGHTHVADCHREEDGLWVLNPGSCGYGGGSAAIVEICDKKITACRLIGRHDLEENL